MKYVGYMEYDSFSRYVKDRVIDDNIRFYLEYSSSVDLSSIRYVEHEITSADYNRLTAIAQYYYNNPLYAWMIAEINGIQQFLWTPPIGTKIKIPYKEDIIRLYNQLGRN